jgi:UDP-sulfoquinovose synthase
VKQDILYPSNPGSIYHMTKCLDQLLFQFYAKNDGLRITDLHQGIVWGTHTDQTRRMSSWSTASTMTATTAPCSTAS